MWSEFTVKERTVPVLVLSCKYETEVTCCVTPAVVYHFDTAANLTSLAKFRVFPTTMVMWPKGDDPLLTV